MAVTPSSASTTFLFMLTLLFVSGAGGRKLGAAALSSTAAQFLNPHNALRARMGLPPLQWSSQLAKVALAYADQRKADCGLVHSTLSYGENIFWGQGRSWSIGDAVAAWAAEQKYYDYNANACAANADCTHYTQMVWRTTTSVGCAKVYCNSGDTYVVCEYDPHGNVIGERPY